jgi:hypothetical protein
MLTKKDFKFKIVNDQNFDDFASFETQLEYCEKWQDEDEKFIQSIKDLVKSGKCVLHLLYIQNKLAGLVALNVDNISFEKDNIEYKSFYLCIEALYISYPFREKAGYKINNQIKTSHYIMQYVEHIIFEKIEQELDALININYNLAHLEFLGNLKGIALIPANDSESLIRFYKEECNFINEQDHWLYKIIR